MLKEEILQVDLKKKRRKRTYSMAPLAGKLLESNVTCSSRGSIKDKPEILMVGMHFDMSI